MDGKVEKRYASPLLLRGALIKSSAITNLNFWNAWRARRCVANPRDTPPSIAEVCALLRIPPDIQKFKLVMAELLLRDVFQSAGRWHEANID